MSRARIASIGTEERRARLAWRHHLARRVSSVDEVARAVVGLHSSDPTSVYLSAWARTEGLAVADVEDVLYERRSLVRMLGMRRTIFVVPRDTAAAMDEACAKDLAPPERRRLAGMLEGQGVAPPGGGARWVSRVQRATLEALDRRGQATARELTGDVPDLGAKLRFGEGKAWEGMMGVSTRVLFLLATEGRVVRARPLGTWISGQYRWARTETWLGAPLPPLERAEACAELLRRYLAAFGPATMTDVRWWTGWTAKRSAATLEALGAVEVALEGGVGFAVPEDLDPVEPPEPWIALLPSLDPTIMGWKERAWYLGDHAPLLFDRAGNAGPTVWVNGRAVGAWAHADDGEVRVVLLERVDARARRAIDLEREHLRTWLGDVRLKPRFRTPLDRELAAG